MSMIYEAAQLVCDCGGLRRAAIINFGGEMQTARKLHIWECTSKEVVILEQFGRSFRSLAKKAGGYRAMVRYYRNKASVRLLSAPF